MYASHRCASYGITSGMEWRPKPSIPLSHVLWFIRDSHPHITAVYILKYTVEIVSGSHRSQAMPSYQGWNNAENLVSHYLMSADFIRDSHPHSSTVYILKYTIEISVCITPLARYGITISTDVIPSTFRDWNYLMSADLFGYPTPISRLSVNCEIYH